MVDVSDARLRMFQMGRVSCYWYVQMDDPRKIHSSSASPRGFLLLLDRHFGIGDSGAAVHFATSCTSHSPSRQDSLDARTLGLTRPVEGRAPAAAEHPSTPAGSRPKASKTHMY